MLKKCQPDHMERGDYLAIMGPSRFRQDHPPDEHYRLSGRSHFRYLSELDGQNLKDMG